MVFAARRCASIARCSPKDSRAMCGIAGVAWTSDGRTGRGRRRLADDRRLVAPRTGRQRDLPLGSRPAAHATGSAGSRDSRRRRVAVPGRRWGIAGCRSSIWAPDSSPRRTKIRPSGSPSTARSTTTRSCGPTSKRGDTASGRTATPRRSSICTKSTAPIASPISAECSRWPSGTTAKNGCFSRATASAKSPCSIAWKRIGSSSAAS